MLKEERKSKVKDNKENLKRLTNSLICDEPDEISAIELAPSPMIRDLKQEQEEKELLEVSLLADDEDFAMDQLEAPVPAPVKSAPVVVKTSPAPKTMTAKPMSVESTIFNELKGIDFETEIREEDEGKIDWNTVSCWTKNFNNILIELLFRNRKR